MRNKISQKVYLSVLVEALFFLSVAFGFLPRTVILYESIAILVWLAILIPKARIQFFILSIPWFAALPLTKTHDSTANWRVFLAAIFIYWFLGNAKDIWQAWRAKKLSGTLHLSAIDYSFYVFLIVQVILLFAAGRFLGPGLKQIIWLFNIYLLFFLTKQVIKTEEDKKAILHSFFWAGATIVIVGLAQLVFFLRTTEMYFWQYWSSTVIPTIYGQVFANVTSISNSWFVFNSDGSAGLRMFSLEPSSQVFGVMAIFTLALSVFLYQQTKQKGWRIFYAIVACLAAFGAVQTAVRGILLAIIPLAVIAIVLKLAKKIDKGTLKLALIPLALFLVFYVASPVIDLGLRAVSLTHQSGSDLLKRSGSSFGLDSDSNAKRLEIWKASFKSFTNHPIAGVGAGNFSIILSNQTNPANFNQAVDTKDVQLGIPVSRLSAHDLYLHILVESGIIGLAFYLVFLFFALRLIWRKFKAGDGVNKSLAVMFGVAILWILFHGFLDAILYLDYQPQMFLWAGLALLDNKVNG